MMINLRGILFSHTTVGFLLNLSIYNMEVILMVGISGSGKTTLSELAFPNHAHVSLDVLRMISTPEKIDMLEQHKHMSCCKELSNERKRACVLLHKYLSEGRNVIIDDTNLTKDIRARHISTTQSYGGTVRAVHFTNTSQAVNYNRKRMKSLNDSVLSEQREKIITPTNKEGFEYIQQMPAWFCYIGNAGNLVGKMTRASQC